MSDLISRQAAIEAAIEAVDRWDGGYNYERELCIVEGLQRVPSEQRWIPFQFRAVTDEEKEELLHWDIGECEEMLCGESLDDGQEILVSYNGYVFTDTFEFDEGYYLDGIGEIEHGMAWQPLPEPYKAKE